MYAPSSFYSLSFLNFRNSYNAPAVCLCSERSVQKDKNLMNVCIIHRLHSANLDHQFFYSKLNYLLKSKIFQNLKDIFKVYHKNHRITDTQVTQY